MVNSQDMVSEDSSNEFSSDNQFEDPNYVHISPVPQASPRTADRFEQMLSQLQNDRTRAQTPGDDVPENHIDDDFEMNQWLRLNEQANEERANMQNLTDPERRPKKKSLIDKLREKQLELVDQQLNVHKTLLKSAEILQKEAEERLALSKTQHMSAKIDLLLTKFEAQKQNLNIENL